MDRSLPSSVGQRRCPTPPDAGLRLSSCTPAWVLLLLSEQCDDPATLAARLRELGIDVDLSELRRHLRHLVRTGMARCAHPATTPASHEPAYRVTELGCAALDVCAEVMRDTSDILELFLRRHRLWTAASPSTAGAADPLAGSV